MCVLFGCLGSHLKGSKQDMFLNVSETERNIYCCVSYIIAWNVGQSGRKIHGALVSNVATLIAAFLLITPPLLRAAHELHVKFQVVACHQPMYGVDTIYPQQKKVRLNQEIERRKQFILWRACRCGSI